MAYPRRSRRKLTSLAAAITAAALLAGCGGSAVTEATDASAPVAAGPETGAAAGPETAAGAQAAPASAAAAGPVAVGAASAVGKEGAASVQAGTAKAGSNTKGRAVAVAGGSAVEKLIASAPIFGGTAACKPATLSEVSIGNVSTLSGVLGELFGPVAPALETFVASQNACGGLNGHKIKFFIEDDQGDPSTASSKVQGLIQANKVLAFVGNIQPLTVDAILPMIKKYNIPVIGSDITNNTWFSNPLLFPQGPPGQSISYGFLKSATTDYFKKKAFGHAWCIEVPRACEQIDRAAKEMAPQLGVDFKKSIQVSITAPSYVQQCLDFKNAGVEVLAMSFDAATMNRMARSCQQVGFTPNIAAYPLGVGNEKQYFGNKWLGNAYIPLNTFPWMGNSTGPEKYWQASVAKYNPGFASGGSASLGWSAGALLVAASAGLSEANPTTQQFIDTLYQFKGQEFTKLGGLAPGPLTFRQGSTPKVPYCLFAAITNAANTGWATPISKSSCTDILAPSDPQKTS